MGLLRDIGRKVAKGDDLRNGVYVASAGGAADPPAVEKDGLAAMEGSEILHHEGAERLLHALGLDPLKRPYPPRVVRHRLFYGLEGGGMKARALRFSMHSVWLGRENQPELSWRKVSLPLGRLPAKSDWRSKL